MGSYPSVQGSRRHQQLLLDRRKREASERDSGPNSQHLNEQHVKNEKLQTSLKQYDHLISTAETTLRTMEEQKTVFIESIAHYD